MGRVIGSQAGTTKCPRSIKKNAAKQRQLNKWDPERLQKALDEFTEGKLSLRQISRAWGIPKSTLQRRISGRVKKIGHASGRPTALPSEVESQLCEYLKDMSRRGFPLTARDVRKLAYQYATKHGFAGLGSSKTGMAGRYWFSHFIARYKDLSLHKPEGLSAARAMSCNEQVVTQWHAKYKEVVESLGISQIPSHIWNCDETGLQDVFLPSKVVGEKGIPTYQVTSAERGETVTVLGCFNAVGTYAPLLVIFRGKRLKPEWAVGSPAGTVIRMTDSGWISTETFVDWGKEFLKFVPKDGLPHLLLLDGHGSHVYNTEFLDLMSSNNVTIMCFPSHTTHLLQPADISLFKSLKSHWTTEGLAFNRAHGGKKPGRSDFFSIFTAAWSRAASVENAQSGFRSAGLFPVDSAVVKSIVFMPSRTTDRPLETVPTTDSPSTQRLSEADVTITTVSHDANPSEPEVSVAADHSSISPDVAAAGNLETERLPDVEISTVNEPIRSSIEQLLPIPTRARTANTRKRVKPPSHILTSPEHASFLTTISEKKKNNLKEGKNVSTTKMTKQSGKKSKKEKQNVESEDHSSCGLCYEHYGDLSSKKIDDDWLKCSKCDVWFHETCAEDCGLVDVDVFVCGTCFK